MEFQKRGALHFHIFLNGEVAKEEVSAAWYRIVGSGDERHLRAGTRVEALREHHAAAAYAAKYASKADQKDVPEEFTDVGRFWGTFGGVEAVPVAQASYEQVLLNVETGELRHSPAVGAIRVCRGIMNAKRRAAGRPKFKDGGRFGFTGYDLGPAIALYLGRGGGDPGVKHSLN